MHWMDSRTTVDRLGPSIMNVWVGGRGAVMDLVGSKRRPSCDDAGGLKSSPAH